MSIIEEDDKLPPAAERTLDRVARHAIANEEEADRLRATEEPHEAALRQVKRAGELVWDLIEGLGSK